MFPVAGFLDFIELFARFKVSSIHAIEGKRIAIGKIRVFPIIAKISLKQIHVQIHSDCDYRNLDFTKSQLWDPC